MTGLSGTHRISGDELLDLFRGQFALSHLDEITIFAIVPSLLPIFADAVAQHVASDIDSCITARSPAMQCGDRGWRQGHGSQGVPTPKT